MHLRKKQLGATPVFGIFLNYPFWCHKDHSALSPNTGLFLAYILNYQAFTVV